VSVQTSSVADRDRAPLEPGSAELQQLLEAIGEGAFERERDDVSPFDAIDLVRGSRFGALRVPREQGGSGSSLREFFGVLIALAAVDPNVAHILRAHFYFVESRLSSPHVERRARWLAEVVNGGIFGSALTELGPIDTGAFDPAAFRTILAPEGDDFVLNGTKYYSTGSLYSDRVVVVAATPDQRIVSAVVPADREGVRLQDDWDGMGQRLTGTGTSHFDQVFVAADEVIDESAVARLPSYGGAFLQLYLTGVIAGIIRAAAEDAVALVRRRTRTFTHASGATPAADPLLQQVVGQIASHAFAAEAIVLSAADAIDAAAASVGEAGADPDLALNASLRASQAKVAVDELALRAGWQVFDVGGASATKRVDNLDRHWRNARTITSHNPTVYKARAIGDHFINGAPLPSSWFF
jgi:alkylation response protein AidB-like acyl-CoA dehydrogenase